MLSVKHFFVGCLLLMLVLVCQPSAAFASIIQVCNQSGQSQVYHVHELDWCHDIIPSDGTLSNGKCQNVSVSPAGFGETPKCAVDIDKADDKGHYYGVEHVLYTDSGTISQCVVGDWDTKYITGGIQLAYKGPGNC